MSQLLCTGLCVLFAGELSAQFNGRPAEGFLRPPPHAKTLEFLVQADPHISTKKFTQRLDHLNTTDLTTWEQRYMINSKYYKKGGPMFLLIGGESPMWTWMIDWGNWMVAAKTHNAILFILEHRYYGESHPVQDLSTPNLKWLSSEQALGDLVHFIRSMKAEHKLNGAKVLVFGGSYSGSLAAWFREKHPEMADGAVGSSAPLLAQVDFYQYLEVVGTSLDKFSPGCSSTLRKAFELVDSMVKSAKTEDLQYSFNLCETPDVKDQYAVQALFQTLIQVWQHDAQSNNHEALIKDKCSKMQNTKLGTLFERLAVVSRPSQGCLNANYKHNIEALRDTDWNSQTNKNGGRQWMYQTCTEFGFYTTTDSQKQPFGSHVTLEYEEDTFCRRVFGIDPNKICEGVTQTNSKYGGKGIKATSVILSNGSLDPWHPLGLTKSQAGIDVIFIEGSTHTQDMGQDQPGDSDELKTGRLKIIEKINLILK